MPCGAVATFDKSPALDLRQLPIAVGAYDAAVHSTSSTVRPFAHTRTQHRIALTMLLVWLLAMASGWANACLLQDGRTHLHGSTDPQTLVVQAVVVSPGHQGMDSDHPENEGAAKGACLKVCGDGAQTIVKLTHGIDLLDLPMAPLVALAWAASMTAAAPVTAGLWLPAPGPGVPLRTRLSRLAL